MRGGEVVRGVSGVRATELTGQKEEKKKKEEEKKENCCRRDRTGGRHRSLYKRSSWT